jgi:hypothetical protein
MAGNAEPFTALVPSRRWDERTGLGTWLLNQWLAPQRRRSDFSSRTGAR